GRAVYGAACVVADDLGGDRARQLVGDRGAGGEPEPVEHRVRRQGQQVEQGPGAGGDDAAVQVAVAVPDVVAGVGDKAVADRAVDVAVRQRPRGYPRHGRVERAGNRRRELGGVDVARGV